MITNLNSTEISDIYNKESDSKRFNDASLFLEKNGLIEKDDNSILTK